MGYLNYFCYVTGVGMCLWVTLTISVMLLGSASVHVLHLLFQLCYWDQHEFMGYINHFSYVTGVGMCSLVTLTISVMLLGWACVHGLHYLFQLCYWGQPLIMGFHLCYWGWPVFMEFINYFSYVTRVCLCLWVTLTISVMLLGSACVYGLP